MARVGVNLLVRNIPDMPLQLRATQFAVQSLLDSDLCLTDWRLQIVDDASPCEETRRYLVSLRGWPGRRVYVWRNEEQLGIARGRNRGNQFFAENWQPDYVVEMHTDHIFPQEWCLPLLHVMERNLTVGMLGPMLLTGRPMGWSLEHVEVDFSGPYRTARAAVEEAAARHRGIELIRSGLTHPAMKRWSMLVELGGYDEAMPGLQNYEDTEEAYRATEAGWRIGICPASVVWHWYAFSRTQTTRDHHADYHANGRYCREKHGDRFGAFCDQLGRDMDAAYTKEDK